MFRTINGGIIEDYQRWATTCKCISKRLAKLQYTHTVEYSSVKSIEVVLKVQ